MSTDEDKTSLPEFIPLPAEEESQLKPALSKKAQKRAAKAEHFAATKLERRAREKQARKEKKRQTAAKRAAGELDEDEASLDASREKKKRRIANVESPFGGRVVVDLGFDDKMSEKVSYSVHRSIFMSSLACRKSSHCAPSLRIPTVQIAMQPSHSP